MMIQGRTWCHRTLTQFGLLPGESADYIMCFRAGQGVTDNPVNMVYYQVSLLTAWSFRAVQPGCFREVGLVAAHTRNLVSY